MSKQSNQRYRKELEKSSTGDSQPKKSNIATTNNSTKQSSSYDYKDDFDDISLDYDDDSDNY